MRSARFGIVSRAAARRRHRAKCSNSPQTTHPTNKQVVGVFYDPTSALIRCTRMVRTRPTVLSVATSSHATQRRASGEAISRKVLRRRMLGHRQPHLAHLSRRQHLETSRTRRLMPLAPRQLLRKVILSVALSCSRCQGPSSDVAAQGPVAAPDGSYFCAQCVCTYSHSIQPSGRCCASITCSCA